MKLIDIKPYIRNVKENTGSFSQKDMVTYDHYLIYVAKGSATVSIFTMEKKLKGGSLAIIKPGSVYSLVAEPESEIISINFDYIDLGNYARTYPLSAASAQDFKPKKLVAQIEFEDRPELNSVVFLDNMHFLGENILKIKLEFDMHNSYYREMLSCKMKELIIYIVRYEFEDKKKSTKSNDNKDKIINYIHEHYNEDINNETISGLFNYNSKYLSRVIKKLTGYSIYKYVIMRRISMTLYLLQESDKPISKISEEVGFHDVGHFSRIFKDIMGQSPRAYRNRVRNLSVQKLQEAADDKRL